MFYRRVDAALKGRKCSGDGIVTFALMYCVCVFMQNFILAVFICSVVWRGREGETWNERRERMERHSVCSLTTKESGSNREIVHADENLCMSVAFTRMSRTM